jgi:hypothetical protein
VCFQATTPLWLLIFICMSPGHDQVMCSNAYCYWFLTGVAAALSCADEATAAAPVFLLPIPEDILYHFMGFYVLSRQGKWEFPIAVPISWI